MDWKSKSLGEKIGMVLTVIGIIVIFGFAIYYVSQFLHSFLAVPVILLGLIIYAFCKK